MKLIRGIFVKRRKCSKFYVGPIIKLRLRLNPIKMFTAVSHFLFSSLQTIFSDSMHQPPHTRTQTLIDASEGKQRKPSKNASQELSQSIHLRDSFALNPESCLKLINIDKYPFFLYLMK